MMRGMYAAISGLEAHQTMLDVTANNLANVDTIGYKAQRTTFVDELSQLVRCGRRPERQRAGTNPVQVGLGVQVGSIDNLMTAGSLQSTGNADRRRDPGRRLPARRHRQPERRRLQRPPSTSQYTRAGNLTINPQGFLTTQSGPVRRRLRRHPERDRAEHHLPPSSTDATSTSRRARPTSRSARTAASATSTRTRHRRPSSSGDRRLPVAGHVPQRGRPAARRAARCGAPRPQLRHRRRRHARHGRLRHRRSPATLEMSNVDMATEFTNMITGRARLPGQLDA